MNLREIWILKHLKISSFFKIKKIKKTIIFATHNRELANKADYKLFISDGIIKRVNAGK